MDARARLVVDMRGVKRAIVEPYAVGGQKTLAQPNEAATRLLMRKLGELIDTQLADEELEFVTRHLAERAHIEAFARAQLRPKHRDALAAIANCEPFDSPACARMRAPPRPLTTLGAVAHERVGVRPARVDLRSYVGRLRGFALRQ